MNEAGASILLASLPLAQRPLSLTVPDPHEFITGTTCANPGRLATEIRGNSGNGL